MLRAHAFLDPGALGTYAPGPVVELSVVFEIQISAVASQTQFLAESISEIHVAAVCIRTRLRAL
jgi:hypothetical protein